MVPPLPLKLHNKINLKNFLGGGGGAGGLVSPTTENCSSGILIQIV